MDDMPYRTCCRCKQDKPFSEYYKNSRSSDGLRTSCKTCTKLTNRASVLRHREKRLAEKRDAYYRQKNTPEFQEKRSAYAAKTKKQKSEYDRARHLANAEKIKDRVRKWIKENPDRRRAITFNYDSRRRAWKRGGTTGKQIADWLMTQVKKCKWCGVECQNDFHVDHVIPLSKGGKHEIANFAISCPTCNLRKNAKMPEEFLAYLEIAA